MLRNELETIFYSDSIQKLPEDLTELFLKQSLLNFNSSKNSEKIFKEMLTRSIADFIKKLSVSKLGKNNFDSLLLDQFS